MQSAFQLGHWRWNDNWGLSSLDGVIGDLLCRVDKQINVGDHRLWIAEVRDILPDGDTSMVLPYCRQKYRREGKPLWPHDPGEEDTEKKRC